MTRLDTGGSDYSESPALSNREKNSGSSSPLVGSKRDVRAFLNASLRIKAPEAWTPALKPKTEAAGFSQVFNGSQWTALLEELKSANALGLYAGVSEWGETQELESVLKKILGPKSPPFSYPKSGSGPLEMKFGLCESQQTILDAASLWRSAPTDSTTVEPEVVFVPGLLMDTLGNRLGRGQGYYDRYLSEHPSARRIGTIHSRFVIEEFSNNWIEEHDQTLEVLWTERGIFATPKFRPITHKE